MSPQTPEGNILLFSCKMLHFVHHLQAHHISLLSGAEQDMYSWLLKRLGKQLLATSGNHVDY